MKKKVLITGATGFVGSHILESMLNHPELEPIAACRDKDRLIRQFDGEVREGDLLDSRYLKSLLNDIDIICHAAAWTSLWGQQQNSKQLYLDPTLALIDAAKESCVKRFINVSTTSANPRSSADAFSPGIKKSFWPHLSNVIEVENRLKNIATTELEVTNLRLGIFSGERYSLGLLPILLPRLKTHLVPWVNKGRTKLPLLDGKDIGQAFTRSCLYKQPADYEAFNIVGSEIPTVQEVIEFIHNNYPYPKPHFSVPFAMAYPFAWLMEKLDAIVPWEPLVTRSIIHLIEDTHADNRRAEQLLGYKPQINWQNSVRKQIIALRLRNEPAMSMAKSIS